MRPDASVLLLTTLIGAGQGLFLALFTVQAYALFGLLPVQHGHTFYAHGSLVALVLLACGLAASFFHLGRPERAWRAASQWRTSWLSREVIVLPAFMGTTALYGLARWAGHDAALPVLLLAGLLALVLFVCTGMIYAAVKAIREWASPYTVPNFLVMGLASGLTLAAALAAFTAADWVGPVGRLALAATLLATGLRLAAQRRNQRLVPKSTLQTAIGVRHPRIVQKAQGAMGGSFQTREFASSQPTELLRRQAIRAVVGGWLAPTLLLPVALGSPGLAWVLVAAVLAQLWGLVSERWLFFAQARHPQSLYHPTPT